MESKIDWCDRVWDVSMGCTPVSAGCMVMVFDQHGKQMPEYQGRWDDVMKKIELDTARAPVEVKKLDWREREVSSG